MHAPQGTLGEIFVSESTEWVPLRRCAYTSPDRCGGRSRRTVRGRVTPPRDPHGTTPVRLRPAQRASRCVACTAAFHP